MAIYLEKKIDNTFTSWYIGGIDNIHPEANMATKLKVNLHHRNEAKSHVAVYVYNSDKAALEAVAKSLGLSTSNLLRSLINSVLDNTLEVEI